MSLSRLWWCPWMLRFFYSVCRTSHVRILTLCSTHSFNTWWSNCNIQRWGQRSWRTGWRGYMAYSLWCHGAIVAGVGSLRCCVKRCGQPGKDPWQNRGSWARCSVLGVTPSSLRTAPPLWDSRGAIFWGVLLIYKVVEMCFPEAECCNRSSSCLCKPFLSCDICNNVEVLFHAFTFELLCFYSVITFVVFALLFLWLWKKIVR